MIDPLGLSTVAMPIWARTSSSWRFFSTSFAGSIWIRIAGVCWPPMRTSDTPEIWLIRWARMFSAASSTSMIGATSDCDRQDEDRRVGRIDLAIGRRARQVLRQLPRRGVDRGLDVVGGGVDVAVEIELDGDRRSRRANSSTSSGRRRESARSGARAVAPPTRPWSRAKRPAATPRPRRSESRPAAAARPAATETRRSRPGRSRPSAAWSRPGGE